MAVKVTQSLIEDLHHYEFERTLASIGRDGGTETRGARERMIEFPSHF